MTRNKDMMDSKRRQSCYLDLASTNASTRAANHTTNRPYPVPLYDPEQSIIPPPWIITSKSKTEGILWYCGDDLKAATKLGMDGSGNTSSASSVVGAPFDYVLQVETLKNSLGGPGKPDGRAPPDGGTMAWLHVVAGILVMFNATQVSSSHPLSHH